jgi:protein-tyrosine phosphatase
VCTGNVCRSPLAELVLQQELDKRGVAAEVGSAGLVGDGMAAAPPIIELLVGRGLDARPHRSRLLHTGLLDGVDLVLGMAREHVREVVLTDPAAMDRSFTLKELVRRGRAIGPRPADEALAAWLVRAAEGRRPADILGASEADDIADPIGRRFSVFQRVAAEIERLTADLVDLAWPAVPVPPVSMGLRFT